MIFIALRKTRSVVAISRSRISPTQKAKFHRKQAVRSLKQNKFNAYRFHSLQVAKINSAIVIARMRKK